MTYHFSLFRKQLKQEFRFAVCNQVNQISTKAVAVFAKETCE